MNSHRYPLAFLLAGLGMFVFGFVSASQAADSAAMLVVSRGEVTATSADIERILTQGDPVFVQDQVTTGDKSFAILQFIDGAKVTVRPNSKMIIEQYVFNGGDEDAAILNLLEGGLRIITGVMAKSQPESYKVKTPVALMGVRGTEFSIMLCGDKICDAEKGADQDAE